MFLVLVVYRYRMPSEEYREALTTAVMQYSIKRLKVQKPLLTDVSIYSKTINLLIFTYLGFQPATCNVKCWVLIVLYTVILHCDSKLISKRAQLSKKYMGIDLQPVHENQPYYLHSRQNSGSRNRTPAYCVKAWYTTNSARIGDSYTRKQ